MQRTDIKKVDRAQIALDVSLGLWDTILILLLIPWDWCCLTWKITCAAIVWSWKIFIFTCKWTWKITTFPFKIFFEGFSSGGAEGGYYSAPSYHSASQRQSAQSSYSEPIIDDDQMKIAIVRVKDGQVHCYDANGGYQTRLSGLGTLDNKPESAYIQGDRIIVTYTRGETYVFDRKTASYLTQFH